MENRPTSKLGVRGNPILRWSIGAKLALVFLALALIPMSVTAYYNLTQGQNAVAAVTRENLVGLSRSTAHHIGLLLTENQRASAALAGQPSVILFLAASGDEREALSPRAYQTLQNFADTHPDYDAPGLLDANGIVVASLADTLVGKDRSFRDYFQASIQGQPYVSSMLVGRATGRPGVFLTNPVVTAEGEIVGIDIVWLKADTIWSIIDDVIVGEEGIAYLVDQDGVIIAHPNHDLLYHSLGELTPEAAATISATIRFGTVEGTDTPLIPESLYLDNLATELASPPQSPPIPGGKSGTYRYHSPLDYRDHVVGYTRLGDYPWTVVVDLPEAQFLAPLQQLEAVAWSSAGLVGMIALIVSILLARTITRPIRRLTDAAIAVEQGQPFAPADIEDVTAGRDEIAHMGRTFSGMVLALRQEIAERQQAEERIEHLNLVLRAIRNVNQLITREKDRDRLLKGACDNLIETRGYHNAWTALFDEAGGLVTTAKAGLGEDFLPLVGRLERGELTDCAQRALSQPGVVVTEDPLSTCAGCPLAVNCGGRGAMTVRLEYEGKIYGLSSVSIPADFTADEEERALFEEVAGDIAFALRNIELEESRQRAEEALRESEGKYRLLAENTLDVIWKMDLNLDFTYVNPAIFNMLGFTPEEWIGSRLPEHCSAEEMQKIASIITYELENLETHTGVVFETYFYNGIGEEITCEVNGKILFDETGKPIGFQGTTRDITERKQAEETLQEYSERLEEMVEERTKELRDAQEQLVRREKLAVLGQLAGGVGHELRNPLGVISNAVYFLQMTLPDADETTREYLDIVSSEVRCAEKIVSDLLDFSRTRLADREEIAVSDLISHVLERRPPPENVEVTTEIPSDLPPVFIDPRQIGQVLGNMVTNAYQAMPDGGWLVISVSEDEGTERRGDKGTRRQGDSLPVSSSPCLRVSISDTGCGISEENLEKIFEPLFTTKAKGIGLGLPISRTLVEANGGSIEVESPSTGLRTGEEGKGSTFTVRLPIGRNERRQR